MSGHIPVDSECNPPKWWTDTFKKSRDEAKSGAEALREESSQRWSKTTDPAKKSDK